MVLIKSLAKILQSGRIGFGDYAITWGRLFVIVWHKLLPKSSATVVESFPVLRNVPLPFWPVSTYPNTIFGIRGVEQSRRRVS